MGTVRLWDVQSGEEIRSLSWKKDCPQAIAFSPDGKFVLIGNSEGVLRCWDFARPEQYRNYARLIDEAQSRLTKDNSDAGALKVLGEYYAFRGINDWAVDMLERARKGGVRVSSLTLARCHWLLSEDKNIGQPDRLRHRSTAAVEFHQELDRIKAQPVPKEPEDKLAREQEKLYLNLCLQAVLGTDQAGKTGL